MHLMLLQHGEAVPKEIDPDRPLSTKGSDDIETLGRLLIAAGISVSHAVHSGKTRARQSAAVIANAVAPSLIPRQADGLAPKDPVQPLVARAAGWEQDTLLVGHQPLLGRLLAALLDCRGESGPVAFRPGTLVGLERDDEGGWLVTAVLRPDLYNPDHGD